MSRPWSMKLARERVCKPAPKRGDMMADTGQRIALVTGAGSGIGEEVANRFERDGWKVYRADIAISEAALSKRCDVSSESDWASLAQIIEGDCGRLDVLVNNAGVVREALLPDTTLDVW